MSTKPTNGGNGGRSSDFDVVVVGAGFAGMYMLHRLLQMGFSTRVVEAGSGVAAETVVAIVETMKLMNPVYAGTAGTVTEICLDDGQFAGQGAVLMRVSARAG